MKKFITSLFILFLVANNANSQDKVGTVSAPFLSLASSARGTAMGGAFVAISNDENALIYNPGGLAQVNKNTVSFSNANYFVGSSYQDFTAIINNGNFGAFAIRAFVLNYGEIPVTTIQNPEGTGELFSPMDLSIGLTYSRYLTTSFSFGATVKYVSQQIWNSSATGFAVDLGVLYKSSFKNLRIGMSITNFGTDMTMSGDNLKQAYDIAPENNGNNDRLPVYLATNAWAMPLNFRVGLAMDIYETTLNKITLAVDAKHPSDNSEALDLGAEYGFKNMVFLRAGYRNMFTSMASDAGFAAGFGLNYELNSRNSIRIDYSYQKHEFLNSPQIWTLGITF